MPGHDGTGPLGQGTMTGGGRGFCVYPLSPGSVPFWGRGMGRGFFGRGGGRGFRHRFYATGLPGWMRGGYPADYPEVNPAGNSGAWEMSKEQELNFLKEQAKSLEENLASVRERLATFEKEENKEI